MNPKTDPIDSGVPPAEQIAKLPPEMAIMKMENDNIMALAAARPRNYLKIKEDLLAQLEAYPSFAREAIYSKPVGKKDGIQQYARGPSIRMAEACAEAYGYNRVRCDVVLLDEDHVNLVASFVDYQRGRIWQDSGIVSKFYKSAAGKMVRMADDRFYDVKVKAEASKRIREVILRSIPPGLRADLIEAAERKIEELLDDKTIQKIVGQFASKGITLEQLEEHVGRTFKAGWTKEDRKNLLGLWNSVEAGETSVDSITGTETNGQPVVAQPAAPDLAQGATVTSEPKGPTESRPEPQPPEASDPTVDIVSSIGEISTREQYEDWVFANKEALKGLSPAQQEKVMDALKRYGQRKGFARGGKK